MLICLPFIDNFHCSYNLLKLKFQHKTLVHKKGQPFSPSFPESFIPTLEGKIKEAQGSLSSWMQPDSQGPSFPHPRGEEETPWTPPILFQLHS